MVKNVLNNLENKIFENIEKLTRTISLDIRLSNVKLSGWATITENLDKSITCRLNTAYQKRRGFAQSISSAWFAVLP